jgi:hypothetical protein
MDTTSNDRKIDKKSLQYGMVEHPYRTKQIAE